MWPLPSHPLSGRKKQVGCAWAQASRCPSSQCPSSESVLGFVVWARKDSGVQSEQTLFGVLLYPWICPEKHSLLPHQSTMQTKPPHTLTKGICVPCMWLSPKEGHMLQWQLHLVGCTKASPGDGESRD